MKANEKKILLVMAALFLLTRKGKATGTTTAITNVLSDFIPEVEGFSATPYWDVKQWTWGYGTKVPGSGTNSSINPGGTVTREQAFIYMMDHIQKDYNYLFPLITRSLNANQWAAYLSFSYNLGPGNADNLAANINSNNDAALFIQWAKYIYAGGVVVPALVERRAKEIELWQS